MSASVFKLDHQDNGVIAHSFAVPAGACYRLMHISFKFDIAPTTSEDLTITRDSIFGPDFDVLLYSIDPSAHTLTDLLWLPDEEVFLSGGEAVAIAFPGSDGHRASIVCTFKAVR